jgi:diguanylate cyclase
MNTAERPLTTPFSTVSTPLGGSTPPRAQKKRQHLLRNLQLIAVSFLIDGLVLAGFHLAGTIGWAPVLTYTGAGLAWCALLALPIARGWTQRFKDPGLTLPLVGGSQLLLLTAMVWVPEVNFMFLLAQFVVYIALTLSMSVRQSLLAWPLMSVTVGLTLWLNNCTVTIPHKHLAEQLLSGAFVVLTSWRCVWLGAFISRMTALLKQRNKELSALTSQVDHLAHHDELTGLLNRRSLLEALRHELLRAERTGSALSVGLLDIDKFKTVNDTLGHLAGDQTLQVLARTVLRQTRKSDRFGRYGGEEFLLIMVNTDGQLATIPIERMRQALKNADWSEVAPGFAATFSCGIACHHNGEGAEALIQRADKALRRAKAEGRNCTRLA